MNKTELVSAVAEATGLPKTKAEAALNATLDTIEATLAAGQEVRLPGFGTFMVRDRKAREGRNPQTGEKVSIAAAKVPAFKAGKPFREAVC